jgi:hypothetical protein
MNDLYGIRISHQQVANYAKAAALVVKPFVDTYDYGASPNMVGDETYIKVKGVKGFVWFIMDAVSRSILGYRVSSDRGVGPCILAMRMALQHFKTQSQKLPEPALSCEPYIYTLSPKTLGSPSGIYSHFGKYGFAIYVVSFKY